MVPTPKYNVNISPSGLYICRKVPNQGPGQHDLNLADVTQGPPNSVIKIIGKNSIMRKLVMSTVAYLIFANVTRTSGKEIDEYKGEPAQVIAPSKQICYETDSQPSSGDGSSDGGGSSDGEQSLDNILESLKATLSGFKDLAERTLKNSPYGASKDLPYIASQDLPYGLLRLSQQNLLGGFTDYGSESKIKIPTRYDLERTIFGLEGIGRGSDAEGTLDFLLPISGDGENDLLFANIVASANKADERGMIFGVGYRTALEDIAKVGIIPAINFDRTKNGKTYPWLQIHGELDNILNSGIGLEGTYLQALRNNQPFNNGNELERPEDGFVLEAPINLDKSGNTKLIPGYDFRKGGGLTVSLPTKIKGGWEIEPGYKRVNGKDYLVVGVRWRFSGPKEEGNGITRRVRWPKPRYSSIIVIGGGGEEEPPDNPWSGGGGGGAP